MDNDVLTEVEFWGIVLRNRERRVVCCHPDIEPNVTEWVNREGLSGFIKVVGNPHCPPTTAYVMKDPDWWPEAEIERLRLRHPPTREATT